MRVGQPVKLVATAEAPAGGGAITKAQWDFDGQGKWPLSVSGIDGSSKTLSAETTHTYDKPGTYIAVIRVGAHRHGAKGKGELMYNLGRARVVVK